VGARPDWFTDPDRGILRLARPDLPAVDTAVPTEENRQSMHGRAPDAGAFEYRPTPAQPAQANTGTTSVSESGSPR
jgi:hypothetical protein